MLDQKATESPETADAFTLFAQSPGDPKHPGTAQANFLPDDAAHPVAANVYQDASGALRLSLGE